MKSQKKRDRDFQKSESISQTTSQISRLNSDNVKKNLNSMVMREHPGATMTAASSLG